MGNFGTATGPSGNERRDSLPFASLVLRVFMGSVPVELYDAAYVDGASENALLPVGCYRSPRNQAGGQ